MVGNLRAFGRGMRINAVLFAYRDFMRISSIYVDVMMVLLPALSILYVIRSGRETNIDRSLSRLSNGKRASDRGNNRIPSYIPQ